MKNRRGGGGDRVKTVFFLVLLFRNYCLGVFYPYQSMSLGPSEIHNRYAKSTSGISGTYQVIKFYLQAENAYLFPAHLREKLGMKITGNTACILKC